MGYAVESEIHQQLERLAPTEQRKVLEFARTLVRSGPSPTIGKDLLRFVGLIPASDLAAISEAIEAGCEQVHANEW